MAKIKYLLKNYSFIFPNSLSILKYAKNLTKILIYLARLGGSVTLLRLKAKNLNNTEQMSDAQLQAKMIISEEFLVENQPELGLTLDDLAAFTGSFEEFRLASETLELSKALLKSNAKYRTYKRETAKVLIAQYAQAWRANPQIPDSTLILLGVPMHRTKVSPLSPQMRTNPAISGDINGLLTYSWKRNGNNFGTIFSIETAPTIDGPWQVYDVTTKTKIQVETTPETPIFFRVCAKKNNQTTAYSNIISMWTGSNIVPELKASSTIII